MKNNGFLTIAVLTMLALSFSGIVSAQPAKEPPKKEAGKLKVLFLCTGNSCRSQMAEGFARALKGDVIEPYSAGVKPSGKNPKAVLVMQEAGIDIANQASKDVKTLLDVPFDYVVAVCSNAEETCPVFPGNAKLVRHLFEDPPKLEKEVEGEEAKLDCYRRVRDEIKAYVSTLPESLDREVVSDGKTTVTQNESKSVSKSRRSLRPFQRIRRAR